MKQHNLQARARHRWWAQVAMVVLLAIAAPIASAAITFDERVACQREIERVYWGHRTWPERNPGVKPRLEAVAPDDLFRRRAEDAVAMTSALEALWGETLGAEALQRELDRMARDSRRPAVLAQIFAALGSDPERVAECLARPRLAERRLRARFATDDAIHRDSRRRAARDLADVTSAQQLDRLPGARQETWVRSEGSEAPAGMDPEEWRVATQELARLTGGSSLRPGAVSDLQDSEEGLWAVGILDSAPGKVHLVRVSWPKISFDDWWAEERLRHGGGSVDRPAVLRLPELGGGPAPDSWAPTPALPRASRDVQSIWTGAELVVFGGSSSFSLGGRYDPALDAWYPISIVGEPGKRRDHSVVWTGQEMIVWGGWGFDSTTNVLDDGARYDPMTDTWTPLSQTGAPSARSLHTAVWSGAEMIVWGGCPHFQCFSTVDDGARYDPLIDSWAPVALADAPSARGEHTATWTGTEMVIWGGNGGGVTPDALGTGGAYDPTTDQWRVTALAGSPADRLRHTAVWTGSEMIVWGGLGVAGFLDSGGRYDPAADSWAPTTASAAPVERRFHTAVWTGEAMVVWGGCRDSECSQHQGNGGRYDPLTDSWSPVATAGNPGGRSRHTAVWTGQEMLVWGGCSGGECQIARPDGGRYAPASDSWSAIGDPGTPSARLNHSAVWTGAEMIVWGGNAQGQGLVLTGGRYDPATDSWQPTAIDGTASARDLHSAVWTGSEMIVWGGRVKGIGTAPIGARYSPTTDTWTGTTTTGAAEARAAHTATWTGSEMIVWGGCRFSDCQSYLDTGGRYLPATDEWLPMSLTSAPTPRFAHTAVQTASEMIVWGGRDTGAALADGGRYDPTLDQWTPTTNLGAPAGRSGHSALWSGTEMIVWGGDDGAAALATGGSYDPASDAWASVAAADAPAARTSHVAAWDGAAMLVWGGCDAPGCAAFQGDAFFTSGGRYTPASDSWSPTTLSFAPLGRSHGTAVWSGDRMLVWGGWRGTSAEMTHTGGLYTPADGNLIFGDGFESGDTSSWDLVVD